MIPEAPYQPQAVAAFLSECALELSAPFLVPQIHVENAVSSLDDSIPLTVVTSVFEKMSSRARSEVKAYIGHTMIVDQVQQLQSLAKEDAVRTRRRPRAAWRSIDVRYCSVRSPSPLLLFPTEITGREDFPAVRRSLMRAMETSQSSWQKSLVYDSIAARVSALDVRSLPNIFASKNSAAMQKLAQLLDSADQLSRLLHRPSTAIVEAMRMERGTKWDRIDATGDEKEQREPPLTHEVLHDILKKQHRT